MVENIVRETVNIDEMQFGFCPGRGTTDAIFILRQLQERYLAKHRKLYTAFEEFEIKVGVHQVSVLSLLLFIIVLEALSHEFRVGCPWEMFYGDDLVILAETFEGYITKMAVWKNGPELKGLKLIMGKTKFMISCRDLHRLQTSGKYPCVQYAGKVLERTQSPVKDACFGLTKGVPISQVD